MHLVITSVGTGLPAGIVAALDACLRSAEIVHRDSLDPLDPHTPLERLMGRLRGLPADAALPLAAWRLEDRSRPWVFVGPLHVQLQASQALALDPALLDLDATASQACWALLAELFPDAEGWQRVWLDPLTWALGHEQLADLRLASRERAVDRPLTPWLPEDRRLRRWTNEAQMLLHTQGGAGLRPNSIWFWGAGRHAGTALPAGLRVDDRLAAPLRAGDEPALAAAWRELIALIEAMPAGARISLVGEQASLTLSLAARSWWRRLTGRGPRAAELLAGL